MANAQAQLGPQGKGEEVGGHPKQKCGGRKKENPAQESPVRKTNSKLPTDPTILKQQQGSAQHEAGTSSRQSGHAPTDPQQKAAQKP